MLIVFTELANLFHGCMMNSLVELKEYIFFVQVLINVHKASMLAYNLYHARVASELPTQPIILKNVGTFEGEKLEEIFKYFSKTPLSNSLLFLRH